MKIKFKHVAFVSLLVAGVGLEIGGIFLPPLIPVGAVCLAGAIAMTKTKKKKEAQEGDANPVVQQEENLRDDKNSNSSDELKVDVSVHHKKKRKRDSQLMFKAKREQNDVEDNSESKCQDQESVLSKHKP